MNQHLARTSGMSVATRRQLLAGVAAVAATGLTAATAQPGVATAAAVPASNAFGLAAATNKDGIDHKVIKRWAQDTWNSLVAMTDPRTGLPADYIGDSISSPRRSGFTSPTNIGGYMWSTVVARELRLISANECRDRLTQTLTTLSRLKHHEPSGMLYNWYDEATGGVITVWPENGNVVQPFLSSVDNGWFAAALMVVRNSEPKIAHLAESILHRMNFGIFYNKDARPGVAAGLLRGGFYDAKPTVNTVQGNYLANGPDVYYTPNHYDVTNSEPRIATYIGIALGQIPPAHYFATMRVFPDTCDWSWQEQQPIGEHRTYLGIDVFEGAYTYRGMRIVPSWGGDMFESLMPDLFVPEASWAPKAWGINHPLTVRAQREFGLEDAKYGYWGFSPASHPNGGYSEWGVDALGMSSEGYPSDVERTSVDNGFGECRPSANPTPTWGDGVVTPHASFLAMEYEPREAYDNLMRMEKDLGAYGQGGFFDAVAVKSGTVARRYLSLDQAMVLGALGNVFGDNVIRRNFVRGEVEKVIKPLIAVEEFGAGLVG
ncbi:glucoamylase family protein [Paenarthrobacter sp. NPDC089714]|uniref:glucoamylase family protein n=1 Tax=Paenarthrobacter sp. NPDC089714 TaxID=3364377 RepID=UPI0037F48145